MRPVQPGDTGRGPNSIEPLLITMETFADIIGQGKTTCFAIVKRGDVETVQVGRRRMPIYESVKAYVARLREQAKAPIAA